MYAGVKPPSKRSLTHLITGKVFGGEGRRGGSHSLTYTLIDGGAAALCGQVTSWTGDAERTSSAGLVAAERARLAHSAIYELTGGAVS